MAHRQNHRSDRCGFGSTRRAMISAPLTKSVDADSVLCYPVVYRAHSLANNTSKQVSTVSICLPKAGQTIH